MLVLQTNQIETKNRGSDRTFVFIFHMKNYSEPNICFAFSIDDLIVARNLSSAVVFIWKIHFFAFDMQYVALNFKQIFRKMFRFKFLLKEAKIA